MLVLAYVESGSTIRVSLQDFSQQPPAQELVARDLHDNEWKLRHIFCGGNVTRVNLYRQRKIRRILKRGVLIRIHPNQRFCKLQSYSRNAFYISDSITFNCVGLFAFCANNDGLILFKYKVRTVKGVQGCTGKSENQNCAIIFTHGDTLQTIDMNQVCCAVHPIHEVPSSPCLLYFHILFCRTIFKMRNILQEFIRHHGEHPPTIPGLREHIFTRRVRFHYGHPDLFDRVFHLSRGGISKASKTINLSEDVFAGFNSTIRRGHVTYHEYIHVGKGRDVGLNQISKLKQK